MAAGCAFFASSPGICHVLGTGLKQWTDLPSGFLMAILLPHLLREAGALQPERVGELLYPIAGTDIFALTAADFKAPRTIALFLEFFDALNDELVLKIPSSLEDAGLTDEQIERVQSRVGNGPADDHMARIIYGARQRAPG
jgi:alcohol dehydrogenase